MAADDLPFISKPIIDFLIQEPHATPNVLKQIEQLPITVSATKYKVKKTKTSGKEGAKDIPSWAQGYKPEVGQSGREFAEDVMGDHYEHTPFGGGQWKKNADKKAEAKKNQKMGG